MLVFEPHSNISHISSLHPKLSSAPLTVQLQLGLETEVAHHHRLYLVEAVRSGAVEVYFVYTTTRVNGIRYLGVVELVVGGEGEVVGSLHGLVSKMVVKISFGVRGWRRVYSIELRDLAPPRPLLFIQLHLVNHIQK